MVDQQTTVELSLIIAALNQLSDTSIDLKDKAGAILVAFWFLVEGIRFAVISNVVSSLIQDNPRDYIYDYFYELAEIWARVSLIALLPTKKT